MIFYPFRVSPSLLGTSYIKFSVVELTVMTIDQIMLQEIKESEVWIMREKEESTYKRDLEKRIELINWVLQNMKNPEVEICSLIESRMNETIQEINQTHSIFQSDKLHSELRILYWIFYQVCINQQQSSKKELK